MSLVLPSPPRTPSRRKRKAVDNSQELFETSLIGAALLEDPDEPSETKSDRDEPVEAIGNCGACARHNLRLYACTTCSDRICCVCVVWHWCGDHWLPCCYQCVMCSLCSTDHDTANPVAVFRAWRREERTCTACHATKSAVDAHKQGYRLCEVCQRLFCADHQTFAGGHIKCGACSGAQ